MCIRNFSLIMNLIKSCSWNLRNIWRFFWRVILTIFDDVDDGVNLHHYLNPFRAPPSTSHTTTTTLMATSAHVWRINMLYKKILKCVVLRPIPIVRTSNLGPQNRHFAAPRSSALRVFVCVRSTFISFTVIVVSWWSDTERGRERDTPSPLHTQKRNSVEHIKALGKALQCFSCFQIFVHSSSLFFFYCPLFEIPSHRSSWGTMSYIGNASDLECEKNEFPRPRPTGIVTKMAAHKLSSEPKWADKREDDSDSEVSSPDNFLTKGARSFANYFFIYFVSKAFLRALNCCECA